MLERRGREFADDTRTHPLSPTRDGLRHGKIEPLIPEKVIPKDPVMPMSGGSGGGGGSFTADDFWSGGHTEILCNAQEAMDPYGFYVHESDITLKDPDEYDGVNVNLSRRAWQV